MKNNRQRKSVVMLVFEGKNKTEHNYFKHFNKRENNFNLLLVDSPETDITGMAKNALKTAQRNDIKASYGDKIFCVFDLDLKEDKLIEYINLSQNKTYKDIKFILSNPCFEIWFLFHFEKHPPKLASSQKVKEYMNKYVKNYSEDDDVFEKCNLVNLLQNAIINANNKEKLIKDTNLVDKNPYTQIPLILEEFDKFNN